MHRIFFKAINGRQIHAAAKPAHGLALGVFGGQHAHIHVHRGRIRVARMEHQRHAHGLKRRTGEFGPVLGGAGRQARPAHMRKAAARALKHRAVFQNLGNAIALQHFARRLFPGVYHQRAAVKRDHGAGNARLQVHQVLAHGVGGCGFKHGVILHGAGWTKQRRHAQAAT